MSETNCQAAGCNTLLKRKGISIFEIPKPKSGIPDILNGKKNV